MVGHKVHGPAAVGGRGTEGDQLAAQALGDPQPPAPERHPAAQPHPPALVVGAVGQRRQLGRIGPRAEAIAAGGDGQGQRLMGPHLVVLVAPGVEAGLPGGQIGARRLPAEVALEGAVEALVLAQGLGVVRAAVADGDPQAPQPDRQGRVGMGGVIAPGTAVVDQHAVRQAIALEGRDQVAAHGGGALVGAGDQAEGVARVVVQDGQRMAAPRPTGPAALEVHLPEGVGIGVLEALPGARLAGAPRGVQPVVPPQDGGDGGGRRQGLDPLASQQHAQLARPPGGVLGAQRQHRVLDGRGRLRRTVPRAARAVLQPGGSLRRVAPQPLVARRRRDLEALAQRPPIGPRLAGQRHKLRPQVAHLSLRKRHIPVLHLMPRCVNHVSDHV